MMLELTLAATGRTEADLVDAVEEALRRLREGNTSGFDRNENGSFNYAISEGSA